MIFKLVVIENGERLKLLFDGWSTGGWSTDGGDDAGGLFGWGLGYSDGLNRGIGYGKSMI